MKDSSNPTISRTGRVLEAAKIGFGIGYGTAVIVVAVGQILLGNNIIVAAGKAAAMALPNPVSMTCAAVGAILYGWNALSQQERDEILEKISNGLEVGIQLITSIVDFVIHKSKELLSSENIKELKEFIATTASVFGRTIGDVTHKLTDIVNDGYNTVKRKTGDAIDRGVELASETYRTSSEVADKVASSAKEATEKVAEGVRTKILKKDTSSPESNSSSEG